MRGMNFIKQSMFWLTHISIIHAIHKLLRSGMVISQIGEQIFVTTILTAEVYFLIINYDESYHIL